MINEDILHKYQEIGLDIVVNSNGNIDVRSINNDFTCFRLLTTDRCEQIIRSKVMTAQYFDFNHWEELKNEFHHYYRGKTLTANRVNIILNNFLYAKKSEWRCEL